MDLTGAIGLGPDSLAGDTILKAAGARPVSTPHYQMQASRRWALLYNGILVDRTAHLDETVLRRLAERNVVIQAVVNTILNQVADHYVIPQHDKTLGIAIVQKDRRKELTRVAAKEAARIQDILWNGGVVTEHPSTGQPGVWDGRYEQRADTLPVTVRKLMRDSLVLDRVFISVEAAANAKANPVMYYRAEDAAIMRLVDTPLYRPQIRPDLEGKVSYVMLNPMSYWQVTREYRWDEGDMACRNPRTDFVTFGYGKSEVEQCLDAVLGIIYSMRHNRAYFTDNHIPQGALAVIGNYEQRQIDQLRLALRQDISGPDQAYRFPIIQMPAGQPGSAVNWLPFMDRTRMDMVFRAYIELCVALVSAVFQIAPEEFGFSGFGGPTSALQVPDPETTYQQSQHKGLLPKVHWLTEYLSRNIVERLNPDFELTIQALESRYNPDQLMEAQLDMQLLTNGLTINQIRAQRDEPPIIDPLDTELWRELEQKNKNVWYPSDTAREQALVEEYEQLGGQLGSYPDAPAGGAQGMIQIWMQEHMQQAQQGQQMMDQMAQGDADSQRAQEEQGQAQAGDQMNQMVAGADERESQQAMMQQQAAQQMQQQGLMGIKPVMDAGMRGGAGGGGGGKPPRLAPQVAKMPGMRKSAALKSLGHGPIARSTRRRLVIGPRDEA